MSEPLFSEFNPISAKAFKQHIQVDLKGAHYNDSVIWHSPEGIDVKPFYHREETEQSLTIPGQPEQWKITEEIFILNPKTSAKTANEVLNKGAEAIYFKAGKKFSIEDLFSSLEPHAVPLYFDLQFLDVNFNSQLLQAAQTTSFQIQLLTDPIGHLAAQGNWHQSMEDDLHSLATLISNNQDSCSILSIDSGLYQNAGAGIVQQLAYSLAHANEYFHRYEACMNMQQLTFQLSVGGNYFFEIAKIRALRLLYSSLAGEYNTYEKCHIVTRPSLRNKVLYDYNTNMLRTTTECMSAILGGSNAVINMPYDQLYHKTNEFGQRISRNQLLVLKNESYFEATTNPAEGSYYIESLTEQLAEKALELFKNIEKSGGFLKQLKSGKIQQKIKEHASQEQKDFDEEKKILVGTNKYPNLQDQMKDELQLYPFTKMKPRKTLLEPIIPKRLAEKLEQERLQKEKSAEG